MNDQNHKELQAIAAYNTRNYLIVIYLNECEFFDMLVSLYYAKV